MDWRQIENFLRRVDESLEARRNEAVEFLRGHRMLVATALAEVGYFDIPVSGSGTI
jgi:hypothetical protein